MSNKHTPGPWRSGDAFNTIFGPKGNPVTIATVFKANVPNALLLSAAPELLDALETLTRAIVTQDDATMSAAYNKALRVIKKARGK